MARGHWLDPLARSLLEATGQLPRRARPKPGRGEAPEPDEQELSNAVERDLLDLKLRQNPERRLSDVAEVRHAADLGWRLDVNRASAADWLRLPGISPSQVDLLLRLQQGGVQLSGPEDLERLLELPPSQVAVWEPLLLFRWYGDGAPHAARSSRVDLNHASAAALQQQLPQQPQPQPQQRKRQKRKQLQRKRQKRKLLQRKRQRRKLLQRKRRQRRKH